MSTEIQHGVGASIRIVHQPGNGTCYEAVGLRLDFDGHEGQWLISFPLLGTSYYFQEGGFVAFSYVAEKLGRGRRGEEVCEVDLHEMCKLIACITGGTHGAATDDEGNLKAEGHLVPLGSTELTGDDLDG